MLRWQRRSGRLAFGWVACDNCREYVRGGACLCGYLQCVTLDDVAAGAGRHGCLHVLQAFVLERPRLAVRRVRGLGGV